MADRAASFKRLRGRHIRRCHQLLVAIGGAAAIASGAAAQEPEVGTRLHGHTGSTNVLATHPNGPSPRETARIMQTFARCIVSRQPAAAAAFLAEPYEPNAEPGPDSPVMREMRRSMPNCLGLAGGAVQAEVSGYRYRGMIAEAELARMRDPALPADTEVHKSYDYPWISKVPQQQVIDELGACLAAWRPVDAMALLRTAPEAPAERVALGNIMPLMRACLRRDAVLTSSPGGLRSAIAIGLYHRATDRALPSVIATKAN